MKVTQEIDALITLGFSPLEFLVLPRVIALCLMMPLLCLYSDLMGILGGAADRPGDARPFLDHLLRANRQRDHPNGTVRRRLQKRDLRRADRAFGMPARHAVWRQCFGCWRGRDLRRGHEHRFYCRGLRCHWPWYFISLEFDMSSEGLNGIDPEAQITVRNLTLAYGSFVLMRDLNFTVKRGDVFIIMGGSGCGKSTLLRNMIGLIEPTEGEIFYGKANFTRADAEERRSFFRRFGVLYQSGGLWSSLTLAENVALPLEEYTDLARSRSARSLL